MKRFLEEGTQSSSYLRINNLTRFILRPRVKLLKAVICIINRLKSIFLNVIQIINLVKMPLGSCIIVSKEL